jgi:hypothetical protein
MSWLRIDDGFVDHPKILKTREHAPLVIALQVRALAYASRQLTDGFVPTEALDGMTRDLDELLNTEEISGYHNPDRWAERMVSVGLWEPTDGGYIIHDYLDYNPSAREVRKTRKERALAGRKGGLAKSKQLAKGLLKQKAGTPDRFAVAPSPPLPTPTPKTKEQVQKQAAPDGASLHPIPKPICRECAQVLEALNALTGARNGRGYQVDPLKGHYPRLHSRHQESGVDACLAVVRVVGGRLRRSDDPKFHAFARPRTLFGPEKWSEYVVEASDSEPEPPSRPDPSGTPTRRDPGPVDETVKLRALDEYHERESHGRMRQVRDDGPESAA